MTRRIELKRGRPSAVEKGQERENALLWQHSGWAFSDAPPPFFLKIQASDVVAGLRVDKHYLIDLMLALGTE